MTHHPNRSEGLALVIRNNRRAGNAYVLVRLSIENNTGGDYT